jgi:hypothetical protein
LENERKNMKSELQRKLYEKHPLMLAGMKMGHDCSCLSFGIETEDGWHQIISALLNSIDHPWTTGEAVDGVVFTHECPQVVVDQVKEKFGTLRFYYHLSTTPAIDAIDKASHEAAEKIFNEFSRYVDGAVAMAENMSAITCEIRGTPGALLHQNGSPYGWMKTLCPEEAAIQGYLPAGKGSDE